MRRLPEVALPLHVAEQERESAPELSVVREPDFVKQPDYKPTPDPSPQSGAAEGAGAPPPAAGTDGCDAGEPVSAHSPRVARGRGEPPKPGSGARTPRSTPPRPAAPVQPTSDEVAESPAPSRRLPVFPAPEPPRPPIPPGRPAAAPPVNRTPAPLAPLPPAGSEPLPDDLASERYDAGYVGASRLSGLRNLLVTLGRRSLIQAGDDTGESDPDIEPRFERATVRQAHPETPLPVADAPDDGTPAHLTARPEFLPPKPVVETEREKEVVVRPTPPRRDNVDPDEIQTLPSWRGQYRKKRYPPI